MSYPTVLQPPRVISSTLARGQGIAGPPGNPGTPGGAIVAGTAGAAVSGHMALAYDAAGALVYASADVAEHALAVAGVSTNAAALGDQVTVQRSDVIEHAGWSWTPDAPVYLGLAGALVQTPAPTGLFLQVLGVALTSQRVLLSIQPALFLA